MDPAPSRIERALARLFGDDERTTFGTGWMAGTAAVFLGVIAVCGTLAFRYPALFSTAEFRSRYPVGVLQALLEVTIGVTFLLGAVSMMLRRRKMLGLTGLALSLAALVAGGTSVTAADTPAVPFTIGLDWFALNVLITAAVFVPLERAFPRRPDQTTFRFGWATDGAHFLVSHLAVQTLSFLTLLPATSLAALWQPSGLKATIAGLPFLLQVAGIVVLADLTQYWVHRAFHTVPALWRVHAVHHSSTAMDWLAGSRLHVIDALATRSLVLVPIFLVGFSTNALYAYLVLVSFHAVFVHANVRFRFGWIDYVVTTPRGHHWHHAQAPLDKNFAVHLPLLDRLFGTQHLPGNQWPDDYGLPGGPVPEGYVRQLVYPFARPRPSEAATDLTER